MLMKLDELIRSVIDGEVVELGRYEVLVSKALREITGGVEIYDIQVEETASGERDVFKTFEAFANEDCNIANNFKCNLCGEYIDRPDGFYVDNEMFGTFYDSFGCLVEAFNARYGNDGWTTMLNLHLPEEDDALVGVCLDDFAIHVRLKEDDKYFGEVIIDEKGQAWRRYNIEFISEKFESDFDIGDEKFWEE